MLVRSGSGPWGAGYALHAIAAGLAVLLFALTPTAEAQREAGSTFVLVEFKAQEDVQGEWHVEIQNAAGKAVRNSQVKDLTVRRCRLNTSA